MQLSDTAKEMLFAHYITIETVLRDNAVIVFNNDLQVESGSIHGNGYTYLKNECDSVDVGSDMKIEDFAKVYETYKSNLPSDRKLFSHHISSYVDEYDTAIAYIYFSTFRLCEESEIKRNAQRRVNYTVRDFEWKYAQQRNGKDTLRYLAMFERLGIEL